MPSSTTKRTTTEERARAAARRDPRQMPLPISDDFKEGLIFPSKYVKTFEERIEGLPKWAQKYIHELEEKIAKPLVCGCGDADSAVETSTSVTCQK